MSLKYLLFSSICNRGVQNEVENWIESLIEPKSNAYGSVRFDFYFKKTT